ncbi:SET domain-containing protein [Auriscalpium vulgare]|uniref:SET domain-containing protein n=1 Tax=Auriscalpium vulgare TaxID=40419 RepID=A0ACB8S1E2_9AGAM|nr:SET domain-containing protein [Auriscalpium vulgare]
MRSGDGRNFETLDVEARIVGSEPSGLVAAAQPTLTAVPAASETSSSSPVVIPSPPTYPPETALSMEQRLKAIQRVSYDRNFRLCFFIPPDESTVLAYWPDPQERLLARLAAVPPPAVECRYEIRAVPGKGVGVFATEAIALGALIARERPLVIAPLLMTPESIEAIVRNMPQHIRDACFALHNCKPPSLPHFHGIINTNGIHIGDMPGQSMYGGFGGLYKDISRVNHSCSSNASHRWDLDTLTGELRAQRPIAAGEEVSFSYLSTDMPYGARHAYLRDKYFFTCVCAVCRLPPAARAQDDSARKQLATVSGMVQKGVYFDACAADLPRQLEIAALLEAATEEHPYVWCVVAGRLARTYCALGEREHAVRWASKAMAMTMVETGADGGWAAVVAAPEKTDVWLSQAIGSK